MRFGTLLLLLFSSFFSLAQNKAYYLNSTGNDANDGSNARPWKTVAPANVFNFEPGDTLFFTGGQTFGSVQLQKNDEGLTLASYNGIATLGPLYAYNVGNITIDGLNFVGAGTVNKLDGIKFYMDSTSFGDNSSIVIKNTSVSNFGGNGILFGAWATSNGYHNVQILDCNLFGNSVDGFASFGYYDQVNHSQLYINRVKSYRNYGRTDITATRTGSGFLVGGFDGGIIENCEAFDNGKNNRCPSGGPQGFWCYNSKNLVFQYCVSHDNKAGKLFDGGGFDIDGGSQNCTIQYCYSYNNEGAGLAFFEHGSTTQFTNNAIRYNISENDARRNAHGAIMLWAQDTLNRVKNSQIYNNTIYVTPSATASLNYPVGVLYKWTNFQNLSFFNNVIYTIDTVKILVGSYGSTTFSNNNYYTPGKTVNFKKGGVSLDPLFVNAGGGTDGYKIKGASAMINAGKASPATKDFVSTPVPFNGGYDIGAYESILMAPVANAGADQVITLPADLNLTGSGSDEDGTIEGYSWTRTAGPALYQINTPSNASTTVSNLAEGTYTFRLTVKDNDGKTQYDDVKVVVNPAPPPPGTKFIKVNVYAGSNPYLNTGWNNWNVGSSAASNKMFTGLKYSDGSGSTVNAVLSQTTGISDNGTTYGSGIAPAEVLRYGSTYTGTRTLTLQGLSTSKSYNLEFYASRKTTTTTNNYSIFTINGDVVNLNVVNNLTTKASFLNVVPNASGQILITINQTETYNYLNGFTLVETESNLLKNKFVKTSIFGGTNPFNNSEWNNWNVGTTTATNKSIAALKYSDGTQSAINARLSATTGLSDNGSTYGSGMAPAEVLRYTSACTYPRTLTFTGLSTTNTYSLELYASRYNTGNSTTFTVGAAAITIVTDKNKTNAASFTNLIPNEAGELVVSIQNVSTYNYLNGFVLTETTNSTNSVIKKLKDIKQVEAIADALNVKAFPNPTGTYFNLQWNNSQNKLVEIRIMDATGKVLEIQKRSAFASTITLGQNYKQGIYFAECIQGNKKTTVKLVKSIAN